VEKGVKDCFHKPVLLSEVVEYLNLRPGRKYIDATVGGGGHAAAIVEKGGIVLGIDVDPQAVEFAKRSLAAKFKVQNSKFKIIRGNFKEIEKIAKENNFYPAAGILYDLGLSSWQLEQSGRGFSFQKDELLDMRADPDLKVTAADLVNGLTEPELTKLFEKYGEEKYARQIAGAIIRSRWDKPLRTSRELAEIASRSVRERGKRRLERIHPATKVFQALRIAVNDELNNLQSSLPQAFGLLEPKGRLAVISYHSLEDRIVKNFFKETGSRGKILTKKPVTPSEAEIVENLRARSAKLRAIEKCQSVNVSKCQGFVTMTP